MAAAIGKILQQLAYRLLNSQDKNGIPVWGYILGLLLFFLLLIVASFQLNLFGNNTTSAGYLPLPAKEFLGTGENIYSSKYGMRKNPVGEGEEFHKGIDFNTVKHTELLSVRDGVVEAIGTDTPPFTGYGGAILIKFTTPLGEVNYSLHAHASAVMVKVGDPVKAGQVIGLEGGDPGDNLPGSSTGHHLHFELRKEKLGGQVDPEPYFKNKLGLIAAYFESGATAETLLSPEVVGKTNDANIGADPFGGASYGIFQLASKQGSTKSFQSWLNTKDLKLSGSDYGSLNGGFYNSWKALANSNPVEFGNYQIEYIVQNYYVSLNNMLKNSSNFDGDTKSIAVQEMILARSIQFGTSGAHKVFAQANLTGSDEQIIKSVYASARNFYPGQTSRLNEEEAMVLALLKK